jgi:hypothetical protein
MAGYYRQSSFVNGDIINADDFNLEFDSLETAFHPSLGHTHDGTEGGGSYIPFISTVNGNTQVSTGTYEGTPDTVVVKAGGVVQYTVTNGQITGALITTDGTLTDVTNNTLVTPLAVKTYVDTLNTAATGRLTVNETDIDNLEQSQTDFETLLTDATTILNGGV